MLKFLTTAAIALSIAVPASALGLSAASQENRLVDCAAWARPRDDAQAYLRWVNTCKYQNDGAAVAASPGASQNGASAPHQGSRLPQQAAISRTQTKPQPKQPADTTQEARLPAAAPPIAKPIDQNPDQGRSAKAEKPAKPEKPAKGEKPAKTEKPAKPGKPAKGEKPAKAEKPAKEHTGQNPGNDKDVGNSPHDGTKGQAPSGKDDTGGEDKGTSKGNASANNGKGGNYETTGHDDNGKGEGRNKK